MNKMTKRFFAPLALAAGVSGAALMGAAPAQASVTPNWGSGSGYTCVNVGLVNVDCNQINPVVNVNILTGKTLSDDQLTVLSNDLNNTKVDVQDIDATVQNFCASIGIPITVKDILVKL